MSLESRMIWGVRTVICQERGFLFLGEGVIRRWRMSDERGVQTAEGASEDDAWA